MISVPGARRRVRATSSKDRLFEASMRLFGSRSPEAVSVDEIAAAAGVSKGTVYYNFGSKDQLIRQILIFGATKLMTELRLAAEHPDPYLGLRGMCEFAVDFVATYPSFAQLWMQEQVEDPGAREQGFPLHAPVSDLIIEVLERLVVLDDAEKLPLATAIFGAALFTARMCAAGVSGLERTQTVLAVMRSVDGLVATHPPAIQG